MPSVDAKVKRQQHRLIHILSKYPEDDPDRVQKAADELAREEQNSVPVEERTTGGDVLSEGPLASPEAEDAALRQLPESPELPEQAGGQRNMRILELIGNIGGALAENKAIGKANKATGQRQARANLVNTLRGANTASVSPVEPKMGTLGTIAQGLGGVGQTIREGREAQAAGGQANFSNEMDIEKLKTNQTKALADLIGASAKGKGKPGVGPNEARLLEAMGANVDGDPYGEFDADEARAAIKANFKEASDDQVEKYLPIVKNKANERRRLDRETVESTKNEILRKAGEVDPGILVEEFMSSISVLDIYVPDEIFNQIIDAINRTEGVVKIGIGERTRFGRIASLRSGIGRILQRIEDPEFAPHLEFLQANIEAFKGSISARLLPPGVKSAMTQLGFTREMLLRTFTGAAAPETEFARFKNDFVGMLRSGQQALTEQMGVLDRELHSMQTEIINAARPIPKIEPLAEDEEEEIDDLFNLIVESEADGD